MTTHFKRTDRIAELMQRELSQLIQQEVKDPRLPSFVTISSVSVTSDLGHAKVYFTVFNEDVKLTATILNAAASYLRSVLARSIKLRTIPQLHFIFDESIEYGKKLSKLIDSVNPDSQEDNGSEKPVLPNENQ